MSADLPGKRPVYLPSEELQDKPLPVKKLKPARWHRIHLDCHDAIFFSRNVNHRFSPADGKHAVMYAGKDFETAFMEVFGDRILTDRATISAARWNRSMISTLSTPALRLCDCTSTNALAALKTDLSSLFYHDLTVPQTWSREIMRHSDDVDGILFKRRFTGALCIALFDSVKLTTTSAPLAFLKYEPALQMLDQHEIALV